MPDDDGTLVVGILKEDGTGFATKVVVLLVAEGISNDDKSKLEDGRGDVGWMVGCECES